MAVEAPEIIEVDTTPRLLRRRWRGARPPARLSRNGRREFRRMPLLRPPLRAEAGSRLALTQTARRPVKSGDHLYLIDGSGYLFRAYHALPPLSRKADGLADRRRLRFRQHAVEAAGGHQGGRQADSPGRDLRRGQEDVPQRSLSALQGQPPRAAGGFDPAIPAGARGDARLWRAGDRGAGLRGRRSDRDLCANCARGRRQGHHRILRQGLDAARRRWRGGIVRSGQEQATGFGRRHRKIRRAALEGRRGPGARRRFDRQRAGRARHRHQDRGRTDQCLWRSRNAAGARGRNQTTQKARDADRERRKCAHFAQARDARRSCGAETRNRRIRHRRARSADLDRLSQDDGICQPRAPRGVAFRHRRYRRDCGGAGRRIRCCGRCPIATTAFAAPGATRFANGGDRRARRRHGSRRAGQADSL